MHAFVLEVPRAHQLIDAARWSVWTRQRWKPNAAMKSIVRKDTGEDWDAYVRRLAVEATAWRSRASRTLIHMTKTATSVGRRRSRMRSGLAGRSGCPHHQDGDGRTHLAYKAEHVVDLRRPKPTIEAEVPCD
ncbi:MAG: hypothetical protein R3B91_11190 [Planctomycetaceae bacterium]